MTTWAEAQEAEVAWWGNCTGGLLWAEVEQIEMARRMGLVVDDRLTVHTAGIIWDVGGGPLSLLLKSTGWKQAVVMDPAPYPEWTAMRYHDAGIEVWREDAQEFLRAYHTHTLDPDEVWIYNTLQHVESPELVVALAVQNAPVVRLFEWVEQETNEVHLHTLHADEIAAWAEDAGARLSVSEDGELNGVPCYAGVFTR